MPKYSKEQFEGWTHRFIVRLALNLSEKFDLDYHNLTLYSSSGSYEEIEQFVNERKTDKVLSFTIYHRASKEQDEATSKFLEEWLKND